MATHADHGQECIESESMLPEGPGICTECGHLIGASVRRIASPVWKMVAHGYWQKGEWSATREGSGMWDVIKGIQYRGTFDTLQKAREYVAKMEGK